MIGRLSRQSGSVGSAATLIAAFTVVAQVLAIVRDKALAWSFGLSADLDVYYAAFKLPDMIFIMVGTLVSGAVLVPLIAEKLEQSAEQTRLFVSRIFGVFGVLLVVVAVVGAVVAPWVLPLLFASFDAGQIDKLVGLTQVMMLSPVLMGLSNIFQSVNRAGERFWSFALAPVLYNLGLLVGIFVFMPMAGLGGLAWGVVLGAALHVSVQLLPASQAGLLPLPSWRFVWSEIKEIILLSLPRTVGMFARDITFFVVIVLIAGLGTGMVAAFSMALNLHGVSVAVLGSAVGVAAFSRFAKLLAKGDQDGFVVELGQALRYVLLWGLPLTVIFTVYASHITAVLLQGGSFSTSDTMLVGQLLAIMSVAIVFRSITTPVIHAFYAAKNTKTPFVTNIVVYTLTIASVWWVTQYPPFGWEPALAVVVAVALAMVCNTVALLTLLLVQYKALWSELARGLFKKLAASGALLVVSLWGLNNDVFGQSVSQVFLEAVVVGIGAMVAFVVVNELTADREYLQVRRTVMKSISR